MRWQQTAAVVAAVVMLWCAVVAASPAVAADQPVAVCPPGKVSLAVAPASQGVFALGAFGVVVDRTGLNVQSAGRVLWSSVSRVPFVGAGRARSSSLTAVGSIRCGLGSPAAGGARRSPVPR
ncbi:MAG: hypothetical protein JO342_05255 [Solirubrobacterales bacterium]|nr:hypothetical protein [Solirubrobacterales bacterium]